MAVAVTINGARWWLMEKREGKKETTVAAIKVVQKNNCNNEDCPEK